MLIWINTSLGDAAATPEPQARGLWRPAGQCGARCDDLESR
jgi:hypothetical protein